jgi:tRNA-2-methylthio-N6-dimethylallyladenosine synthase
MQNDVGKTFRVLIECASKKNADEWFGKNDQNKVVVFAKGNWQKGMYVDVYVHRCTAGTLIGEVITQPATVLA